VYAIIDVETTGYGPKGNKVTEIAIFLYDGEKVIDEFTSLVNPECKIPYRIQQITGIDDAMVANSPKFYEIAKKVHQMTENAIFVAHNVSFDFNVIRNEFKELGAAYSRKKLCTVRMSRKLLPGAPRYGLGHLARYLDITIEGRHRARGDAKATVELFQILQSRDHNGTIDSALDRRTKEASLPPNLVRADFDALPDCPGVYYFSNEEGKVIYVGKAKQIRKRVMSHFRSKTIKGLRMCEALHRIKYTETGNELVALLLESDEIKKIYPMYNSAQKRTFDSYALFHYEDRNGVLHIGYDRTRKVKNSPIRFYSIGKARNFLETLVEEFELCPKFCQLQSSNSACFHYGLKKCKGVCCSKEDISAYNERVQMALASIPNLQGDLLILDKGRTPDEEAFVLIDNGLYRGFGYFMIEERPQSKSEFLALIRPMKDNQDVQRLLNSYLRQDGEKHLISFDKKGELLLTT